MEERLRELAIATASIQINKEHLKSMAPIYEKELLKKIREDRLEQVFEKAKQMCKKFPSVAELLEIEGLIWSRYRELK